MKNLFDLLQLSLNEQEVLDYLLYIKAPVKSRDVAGVVELPRQTVYSILCNFAERGLVVQTDRNGVKHFYCDRKELLKFIELERDRLQKAKEILKGDEAHLPRMEKHKLPEVHFYEGSLGTQKLFESILSIYKKGKSKKFRGYGVNSFTDSGALRDYLNYFIKKRASYGVETNLFVAQGPNSFDETLGRTIKKLNIPKQEAGIYLVADRVYLFSYKDNSGVMIENKTIVNMLKDIFDEHWERTK